MIAKNEIQITNEDWRSGFNMQLDEFGALA